MTNTALNDKLLLKTAALWDIEPVKVHRSVEISGSPERSEIRYVIEGSGQNQYVLESVLPKDLEVKKNIIDRLNELKTKNLSGINTYLESKNQITIEQFMGRYWKLSRFIDGCELKRPEYVFDKWRGEVLADFLVRLRKISDSSDILSAGTTFSLRKYVTKLSSEIRQFNPKIAEELDPVFSFLDNRFMANHDQLKTAFCHGDYHPVNVIWGTTDIAAVIDWEFCGVKPEIYDAANLLGCLGIEQPDSLTGPFAIEFISCLKEAEFFSDHSWQNLISFIVALRFAWLAEWLRRGDIEMIEMELVYMKILVNNEKYLGGIWGI